MRKISPGPIQIQQNSS